MKNYNPLEDEMPNLQNLTTKQILVYVITELWNLKKGFSNHLAHHWAITLAALTAALMGTATFVVGILLLLCKK